MLTWLTELGFELAMRFGYDERVISCPFLSPGLEQKFVVAAFLLDSQYSTMARLGALGWSIVISLKDGDGDGGRRGEEAGSNDGTVLCSARLRN